MSTMTEPERGWMFDHDPPECACGVADCEYFELAYPFCRGCGEHHRQPVAVLGPVCPVDLMDRVDWTTGDPLGEDYPRPEFR